MKKKLLTLCILLVFCFVPFGFDSNANEAYQNISAPYNISVTFSDNAATEKNFTWFTDSLDKNQAVVVVREAGGGPEQVFTGIGEIASGRRNYYVDPMLFDNPGNIVSFKVNKVTATGLKPNTRYEYYCGDGRSGNWSGTSYFDTGTETCGFTFLFMSDPQAATNQHFELWKNCSDRALAAFPEAKFAALAGDLVDRGSSEVQWDKFFSYGSDILSRLTVVPAIGNHETDYGPNSFGKHFNFPENAYGLPDYVYSFDMGDVRFMVLSTEKAYDELAAGDEYIRRQAIQFIYSQIDWLKNETLTNPKKWNIVMFHKGIYSSGRYANSNATLLYRNMLAPVFDELSIDVVLQGHNHTFDRAFLYEGKTVPGVSGESKSAVKTKGTLYLTVNTAGPKFYYESAVKPAYLLKHAQPQTQMYAGITVSENYIKVDTYAVAETGSDTLFDTFTLYK